DYPFTYDIPSKEIVKASLDRIYYYLDSVTPIGFVNRNDNIAFNGSMPDTNIVFKKGDFRLTSYEWGVTYAGMLAAGAATKDRKYVDYTRKRILFLAEA